MVHQDLKSCEQFIQLYCSSRTLKFKTPTFKKIEMGFLQESQM